MPAPDKPQLCTDGTNWTPTNTAKTAKNALSPAVFAIFIHFSGDRACIKDSVFIDPCCGSGGMFVQSAALVQSKQGGINRINVYGQEKEAATYRLAKMNLALRGISHNLGETNDSSFTHDLHKGLYFVAIILTPVLMSILSSENAQRVNQSKTYFTLDLLIGWHSTLLRVSRP